MAVIAVTGGPGAPGATTSSLALLLAWPLADGRRVLLVECDPDGGAALAGALEGRVEAVYGLRNLAVADRRGLLAEALWEQLIDVSPGATGDRLLLPGLTDPAQAAGLAYTWEPLVEVLRGLHTQGYDVLLDLGRSGAHGPGAVLARRADCVAATVRTTLRGLSAARPRLAALREDLAAGGGADGLGLLLVTEGPYPASDVTRELRLPVHGELPYAPRPARVLSDGGDSTDRRFIRSELMRAARTAADRLLAVAREQRERLTPVRAGAAVAGVAPQPQPQTSAPGWEVQQPSTPGWEVQQPSTLGWEAPPPQGAWGQPQPAAYSPVPEPSGGHPGHARTGGHQQPEQGRPAGAGDGWGGPVPGTTDAGAAEPVAPAPYAGARRAPQAEAMGTAPRQQAQPDDRGRPARDGTEQPGAAPQGREAGIAGLARVVGDYAPESQGAPAPADEPAVRSWFDGAPGPSGGAADLTPVPSGGVPGVAALGQAFASPAGQVFVPQTGPVQVRPGVAAHPPATAGRPPLAGIAPHPAAPEPFPAPAEETETQGEVLRAR
ncbi:hypothetical protein LN042_00420 [Kitasatospora sp. RB6PN24]|uniref:hypothetical protein n=1 Tax=Kitasatospora humi TaxID=2893891 RepID=UPI001E4A762A|nr:hypothetical protein [Kitasatospora humi]MCC9305593.1 hypothetical protein [Kitasatospora humi]